MLTADKILSEKQWKILHRELKRSKESGHCSHVTTYYLVCLAYYTGLRISEVAALRWNDVGDEYLVVRRGKGGKARSIFMGKHTRRLVDEWKVVAVSDCGSGAGSSQYLFTGQRGPLKRGSIHMRFKEAVRRAGLPSQLSFHSLRHGFATRLLDSGVSLAAVRDLLGHSSVGVTSVYLHFSEESKERLRQIL